MDRNVSSPCWTVQIMASFCSVYAFHPHLDVSCTKTKCPVCISSNRNTVTQHMLQGVHSFDPVKCFLDYFLHCINNNSYCLTVLLNWVTPLGEHYSIQQEGTLERRRRTCDINGPAWRLQVTRYLCFFLKTKHLRGTLGGGGCFRVSRKYTKIRKAYNQWSGRDMDSELF